MGGRVSRQSWVHFVEILFPFILKGSIRRLAESGLLESYSSELPSLSLLLASRGHCPRQWTRARSNWPNFSSRAGIFLPFHLPGIREVRHIGVGMVCFMGLVSFRATEQHGTWMGEQRQFLVSFLGSSLVGGADRRETCRVRFRTNGKVKRKSG